MMTFGQYMQALAQRRGLRRSPEGSSATYRFKHDSRTALTVVTHELDPTRPAQVMSESWPVPLSPSAHAEFLRESLNFNRNALHHLHAGIRLDPLGAHQYRLVWEVPAHPQSEQEWSSRLRLFALLAQRAWDLLPRPGGRVGARPRGEEDGHMIFMP